MKTVRRFLVGMVAVLAVLTATTAPASADTVVFSGLIPAGDAQTMPVVAISSPNCVSQGVSAVAYREHRVAPGESGMFTFTVTPDAGNPVNSLMSLYIMTDGWDPAAALPFCIAGDNTEPVSLTVPLNAFTRYYAVVFDDTFTQVGGGYTLTVEGPGLTPPLTRPDRPIGSTPTTGPTTTTTAPVTTTTEVVTTTTTWEPTTTTAPVTTTTRPVTTTTARPGTVPQAAGARPITGTPGYTG